MSVNEIYCYIKSYVFIQVRINDLAFYESLTDPNGPAMTHAMFAIGWLEVGEKEKAERSFLKNYANIQGPFKVLAKSQFFGVFLPLYCNQFLFEMFSKMPAWVLVMRSSLISISFPNVLSNYHYPDL